MQHGFVVSDDGTSTWSRQAASSASGGNKGQGGGPRKAPQGAASNADTSELEKLILGTVNKDGSIKDTADFLTKHKLSAEELDPVLKSLVALEYLILDVIERKYIELTDEGKSYAANGSPEF